MSGDASRTSTEPGNVLRSRLLFALPHGIMLAAAIVLYWLATGIDVHTGGSGRIGPDAWPKAVIVIMGLLCAYEVAKRLVRGPGGARRAPALETGEAPAAAAPAAHPRKLLGGIALVVAYGASVSWVGFFVATAVFLGVFPWIGGLRRPVFAAVLGIAGSFVLVVLFMRVAYISLPLGEGPFRSLSLALLKLIGVV